MMRLRVLLIIVVKSLVELRNLLQICQHLSLLILCILFKTDKLSIYWVDLYNILRQTLLSIYYDLGMHPANHLIVSTNTYLINWTSLFNQPAFDNPMKLLSIAGEFF